MNPRFACKHLRTKSMFIQALAQKPEGEPEDTPPHSSHCWCNCTLTETGPDDRAVGAQLCSPSRTCFEE
jgi:hypothetical protein